MPDLYLPQSELADFTGYQRPGKQIAWLKRYGIRFFVAADGHPRVLYADLTAEKVKTNEPNIGALRRAG